jgi:hypothetical protein
MPSEIFQGKYVPHIVERQEMQQRIAQYGTRVMNNFWLRMPGKDFGDDPQSVSENMLEVVTALRDLDKPYGQQRHINGGSELYLSLTPRRFFQVVYTVMEECGITKEDAIQLREDRRNRAISMDDLNKRLLPAYLKLIEMGFSAIELSN